MNTERRYSITEAAPLLWFSVPALMQMLQQHPQYIETFLNWELYKEKGITLEDAQHDPDCVMIHQSELERLQHNQRRFETCNGCGETFLLQALTPCWIQCERVYVCEGCMEKGVLCDLCDDIILEDEPAHDLFVDGAWNYYHPECWKIMNQKENK